MYLNIWGETVIGLGQRNKREQDPLAFSCFQWAQLPKGNRVEVQVQFFFFNCVSLTWISFLQCQTVPSVLERSILNPPTCVVWWSLGLPLRDMTNWKDWSINILHFSKNIAPCLTEVSYSIYDSKYQQKLQVNTKLSDYLGSVVQAFEVTSPQAQRCDVT